MHTRKLQDETAVVELSVSLPFVGRFVSLITSSSAAIFHFSRYCHAAFGSFVEVNKKPFDLSNDKSFFCFTPQCLFQSTSFSMRCVIEHSDPPRTFFSAFFRQDCRGLTRTGGASWRRSSAHLRALNADALKSTRG